jgi:hypothetical protein
MWHALLYHRATALDLGAYTSPETEYAQDWDLVARFTLAGHRAKHVPEILYHWRQHTRSTSHSGKFFDGSARSVGGVLDFIRRSRKPERYEVAPLPIDLGIKDFYLRRLPVDAPATLLVALGDGAIPAVSDSFPFADVATIAGHRGADGLTGLLEALKNEAHPFVMVAGAALASIDENGIWQAIKHLELVADVAAVGGPLIGPGGVILFGTPVLLDAQTLCDPLAGRQAGEPREYSLAVKPHCISALSPDLFVARREFLLSALEAAPKACALRSLGAWLGAFALDGSHLLAYEPLLRGYLRGERDVVGDTVEGLQTTWSNAIPRPRAAVPTRGLASFVRHRNLHK